MILENIHCLLQFDDRGNLLALVSKSSGRNYIVKDGCSLFRLTMTEIIENRVMPGTLALTGDMAEQIDFIQQSQCLEIDSHRRLPNSARRRTPRGAISRAKIAVVCCSAGISTAPPAAAV